MPVTELALLRIHGQDLLQNEVFKSKLEYAKNAMEKFTSREFFYYQQIEDPNLIYIIGNWESTQQHWDHWIPSSANQELLELLKDQISVQWLFHIDIDPQSLPLDAPALAIGRYIMDEKKRPPFYEDITNHRHQLSGEIQPEKLAGGWRLERPAGNEEWVAFSRWNELTQQSDLIEIAASGDHTSLKELLTDLDIKHATKLVIMDQTAASTPKAVSAGHSA